MEARTSMQIISGDDAMRRFLERRQERRKVVNALRDSIRPADVLKPDNHVGAFFLTYIIWRYDDVAEFGYGFVPEFAETAYYIRAGDAVILFRYWMGKNADDPIALSAFQPIAAIESNLPLIVLETFRELALATGRRFEATMVEDHGLFREADWLRQIDAMTYVYDPGGLLFRTQPDLIERTGLGLDSALDRLAGLLVGKHHGPGPHPGTGTPQEVHGGDDGIGESDATGVWGLGLDNESLHAMGMRRGGPFDEWLFREVSITYHPRRKVSYRAIFAFGGTKRYEDRREWFESLAEAKAEGETYLEGWEPRPVERHHGPGPHPGTHTPQEVHAGDQAGAPSLGEVKNLRDIMPPEQAHAERMRLIGATAIPDKRNYRVRRGDLNNSEEFRNWVRDVGGFESVKRGRWAWLHPEDKKTGGWLIFTDEDGTQVAVTVQEEAGYRIDVSHIESRPRGTGAGSRIVKALAQYSALRGNRLEFWKIASPGFFAGFSGWTDVDPVTHFRFEPGDEYRWTDDEYSAMYAADKEAEGVVFDVERHYGPGPHPGTGTAQAVHAGNGVGHDAQIHSRWREQIGERGSVKLGESEGDPTHSPYGWVKVLGSGVRVRHVSEMVGQGHEGIASPQYWAHRGMFGWLDGKVPLILVYTSGDVEDAVETTILWADDILEGAGYDGPFPLIATSPDAGFSYYLVPEDELVMAERSVLRHHGPGPHPGTGSPQEAHAGDDAGGEPEEWTPREDAYAEWEDGDRLVKIISDNGNGTYDVEIVSGPERESNYSAVSMTELWEPDEDDVDRWTSSEPSAVRERAVEVFGLTDDPAEAGYILPDGSMLDFSGKNEGGTPGTRARDHREINTVLLDYAEYPIPAFQQATRAIRMHYSDAPDGGDLSVDFLTAPSRGQKDRIEQIGLQSNYVVWDISTYDADANRWGTLESGEIESPTLEDIEDMLDQVPDVLTSRSVVDLGVPRHYGPGPHPGTGTPQEVHAGNGAGPKAGAGGSRPGVRTVIANAHHQRVEDAIEAARAETGFGEALYTDEGALIYDDREAFTRAAMRQIAQRDFEVGMMIDNRGYVEYESAWGRMTDDWFGGDSNSINVPENTLIAYRESAREGYDPVFIHSHPGIGERSSPPSGMDLRLAYHYGILNQRIAARDGFYEFSFSHTLDETEKEEWRQIADVWSEDHPPSDTFVRARQHRGAGREVDSAVRDETWQRQHDALTYMAQELPDLFRYRFVPWDE